MVKNSNGFLEEYFKKFKTGEIIIGDELSTELANLIEDMNGDDYIYDTSYADTVIDFIENCVKLTKSPFYGMPMKLMLFQKAFISALYGFKMPDGCNRFKKALFLISRKNGKSELCSALGLSEFINGNQGSDIVCSSNDDNQASILYDALDLMRQMIDPKNEDTKRNQRFILNKVTNTKIFKMSDRTRNKEGRNIDVAFQDEAHELKENTIPKSIEQSQSLKINPKFIILTTEGFVTDGYLDEELKRARAIIYREAFDPAANRYLPWLYTQDSEREVWEGNRVNRLWEKSNPTLGTVKRWDYLEEQVAIAKNSKADRIFVLAKDFNIKQNAVESFLNLEDYDYQAVYDLEEMRGAICLGAVDLSETTDLTSAKILMMKPGDKTKYIHSRYFIPASKLEDSDDRNEGARYKEWAEQDFVTITEGNDIDLSVVADWFYSLYTQYNIRLLRCGYDQKFARDWITRMGFYGWQKTGGDESDLILIQQNAQTLSGAIRLCESDFKSQLINYGENPVDKWCYGNACLKVDALSQCLIVKAKPGRRIDGAVCLAILYEMYRRYKNDFKTMVEGAAK